MNVQYPMHKAVTALATGGGSVAMSKALDMSQFIPHTLVDWMAFTASFVAFVYSSCLLGEWVWKKFFRRKNHGTYTK